MSGPASAETVIEKVPNKSLTGAAYARLRNLTYEQCQDRCLKDAQCIAIEHYRGGGVIQRSSNCALFSSIEKTTDSKNSDVGYKRQQTASADGSHVAKRAARGFTRGPGSAAETRESADQVRRAPEAAPSPSITRSARSSDQPAPVQAPPPPPVTAPVTRSVEAPAPATRSVRPATVQPAPPAPPGGVERRAAAPDERFHVVPVFYGTDRNQVKQQNRIGYGNDRAKRLEIGRALISVPFKHNVPNIERPRAWEIPYIGTIQLEKEDPNEHFTVREVKAFSKADFINLVKQRLGGSQTFKNQSIVFIHGYNTGFDGALFRTAQISYDLQFDGATFAYSWPSGGGLASYLYDRDSAQGAERYLYEFLQMVQNETGSTSISIIAHSMGNQMLLQVLRSLKLRAPNAIAKINQIILASPDVDRDAFEALAAEITGVAKGITLYASANDRALDASRIVAGNKPRAGDVPENGPVIVAGIDTIDITQVSTDYLAIHHSGYAEHTDLLIDIAQIIRSGTRPWERRLKAYKPVTLQAGGVYWRYEK
jgi:esterase/lipase superfamily enzyme